MNTTEDQYVQFCIQRLWYSMPAKYKKHKLVMLLKKGSRLWALCLFALITEATFKQCQTATTHANIKYGYKWITVIIDNWTRNRSNHNVILKGPKSPCVKMSCPVHNFLSIITKEASVYNSSLGNSNHCSLGARLSLLFNQSSISLLETMMSRT